MVLEKFSKIVTSEASQESNTCFKQTEIGEIPQDWEIVSIGQVCDVTSGGTPSRNKPEFWNGNIPWVKTGEINYSEIRDTEEKITQEGLSNSSAKLVPRGTLLMAMYGQGVTRGKVAMLGIDAALNQACLAILQGEKIYNQFLYYCLTREYQNLRDIGNETTQKNLNASIVKQVKVPLPSIHEQKEIAAILSSVDEAIASTQAVINQTRKVKQGLLQQLLTRGIGHTKFKHSAIGKIPESWSVVNLQEMGKPNWFVIRSGPFGSSLKTEHFRSEGEPVLTIQSLGEGEISKDGLFYVNAEKAKELSEYRVQAGDLVFSRVADIGRSVVITENEKNWLISSNLMRISVNQEKYNPWFLMYSIVGGGPVTRQIEKLSGTTGRPVVSSTMMKQVAFAIPPIDEQCAIAMHIQQTEEMIRQEALAVDRLVALKNGLMQDLLTGRVRVGGTP